MRLISLLIGILLIATPVEASEPSDTLAAIRAALVRQRAEYPASHYCDVYKNFMQDSFGPGHILADTASAASYLRRELASTSSFGGPDYEPTGHEGNFYRVNLRLLHDSIVPFHVFFSAFVRSVQGIVPPEPEVWRGKWQQIDSVISELGWHFDNENADRLMIAERLRDGDFIVHHSPEFNRASRFHYRIISRQLFESEILPRLSTLKP